MRKIRTCKGSRVSTGSSACSIDWKKVKDAILTERGVKPPADIVGEELLELRHADHLGRTYPILLFLEYARNGGEPQVSVVGYGASKYNGLSAQTDTFTLKKFDEASNVQLLECANRGWDVYF